MGQAFHIYIVMMVVFAIGYVPAYLTAGDELRRYIGWPLVLNVASCLLVGMLTPWPMVYFVFLFVMFLATVRDRVDAACRYFLLVGVLPSPDHYLTVGSASLFTLHGLDVLAFALIVALQVKRGPRPAQPGGIKAEDVLIGLIYIVMWLGVNRITTLTVTGRAAIDQAILILLPYVAMRIAVRKPEEWQIVLGCLAFTGVILTVFAVYEARESWAMFDPFLSNLSEAALNKSTLTRGNALRASTTMSGPLALAVFFTFAFIAALYSREKVRSNLIYVGWLSVITLGMLAAQSRGNLLCLVLALLIFFIVRGKWLYASIISIGAPLGLVGALIAARWSPKLQAFLNVGSANEGDVYDYRQLLLRRGMQEAAKHRWTGAGMEDVMSRLVDIKQGEHIIDFVNTYLVFYLVSGVFGLIVITIAMLAVMRKIVQRLPRNAGQATIDIRAFALTAYMVLLVVLAFMSFIDRVPLLLGMALVASRVVDTERKRARAEMLVPLPPIIAELEEEERQAILAEQRLRPQPA